MLHDLSLVDLFDAGSAPTAAARVRTEARGLLYGFAEYHFERLLARAEKRPMRDDAHQVVTKLLDLAQSSKGWRADKIVEAHTGTPKPPVRKSWMDVIVGRK